MDPRKRASITVTQAVLAAVNDYQDALLSHFGRRASHADIVAALLEGVPLWQAEAMLDAYRPPPEDSQDTDSTS
jgi:hypothetical protein